jgi:glutamate synthase domain-containing protein 2/glutamate synthase domain-containing protein 1/glutamate synthase domain-containing protein 3
MQTSSTGKAVDGHYPLYEARWEHDACGTGFLADVSGSASHLLVEQALTVLANLTHRGAQDADADTNDGAGLLTQIPRALLSAELRERQISLTNPEDLAVGMLFLPSASASPAANVQARQIVEAVLAELHLPLLIWRDPPLDLAVPGAGARSTMPAIVQVVLARPAHLSADEYERELFHARRLIEKRWLEAELVEGYITSFSAQTIVYKGLLAPAELARFYLDLADERYLSSFAILHQRYSTNTFPSWSRAQPMRFLAHNGEINTIQGNQNWMQARERSLASPLWGERLPDLSPVIDPSGSDSGQLDNALELLALSGRNLLHSMQMMIPPAWEQDKELSQEERAWCEYHACCMEPWDGPAALIFGDGHYVGATLDRNGLRPMRYTLTSHGLLIVASEAGALPIDISEVVERGRLGPGEMLAVDLQRGVLLRNQTIKQKLAVKQPYQQWLDAHLLRLSDLTETSSSCTPEALSSDELFQQQQLFGYTHEDVEFVLRPILADSKEPTWSMGDDTPLAALSTRSRSFADYFHQRFAQVTNPPIDPLREERVMSLDCYLGRRPSLLTETQLHARQLHLSTPVLTETQLASLCQLKREGYSTRVLNATFPRANGPEALLTALDRLEAEAVAAALENVDFLILSDREATLDEVPVPMLLAVAAVHQALIHRGLRDYTSLICETASTLDVHQLVLLLGYGAEAVVPYLALASVRALAGQRKLEHITVDQAVESYVHVIEGGLRKVMARMGISTLRNIIGAGLFEIFGLDRALLERCFPSSAAHPGTVSFTQVAEQVLAWIEPLVAQAAVAVAAGKSGPLSESRRKLTDIGRYRFRRDGEYHAYQPLVIRALQKAAKTGSSEDYQQFTQLVYSRPPTTLRDLLSFKERTSVPLEEVESMESIRARFVVSAMSVGALSPETHRTIAAAMNSIGGRNNTGEGGEDPAWYHETFNGYPVSSKIKQVASARFGVTTEYLVRAEELEIKMAQGSKPGEGGQLPPAKVTPFIAHLRHTEPGIALISPPPHHDIYSIEDLAQLIFDLHQVNPQAQIGVKLVSSIGVGTIAAGVAKAHANYVLISGHDGGTGASPMQSIKHAGIPWERGLAETQQTLVKNGLRERVKVRVDGGFKTGRDVIIGAMLGADEFGFGTASLVSLGCDMARQCHLNTCPAGIATQREDLRAKFTGTPEALINFLTLVAEEVREWLAQLGFTRLEDLIGRADLLASDPDAAVEMEPLLVELPVHASTIPRPAPPHSPLSDELLAEAEQALRGECSVLTRHTIHNYDRTIGAGLAGEIARRYGNVGLPGVSITSVFHGSAGQSFGAFAVPGMNLVLHGEANDYVGKSMTGGQIVIAPPVEAGFAAHQNTIIGNTVLYGATGGQLFAAGRAGERFAVRNSGALAVVEGVGAHGCEYMTGGIVVVLGETGPNFGAGMSAGIAYVFDREGTFLRHFNGELVEAQRLADPAEIDAVRTLIEWHRKKTNSWQAARLLAEWSRMQRAFWRVSSSSNAASTQDLLTGMLS